VSLTEQKEASGKKMLGMHAQLADGRRIFFLALHAPTPVRGKAKTLEYIRTGVTWMRGQPEVIRIMAGDFNWHFPWPNDDAAEADDLYREIRSFCADSTAIIGPSFYAHRRIDYIFHAPEALPLVATGCGMINPPNRYTGAPGWRDHRPIVATIRLSQGNSSGKTLPKTHGNEQ